MKNTMQMCALWLKNWGLRSQHDFVLAVCVSASVFTAQVHAENSISSVARAVQGGQEVVRIEAVQPIKEMPLSFSIQDPARISFDFPGYVSNVGRRTTEINQGSVRSAQVIQAGDRTRVVLNLKQSLGYKATIDGATLLIALDAADAGSAAGPKTAVFADDKNNETLTLRDIDFRRGNDNAGRIMVELPNTQVGVDIRQNGKDLVVEFLKSSLPQGLRRQMDVSDFGTPVESVSTVQVDDRVRMTISAKGNWEHSAYQSDSRFVVELKEVKVDPTKLSAGPGYTGKKLSLDFQSIEVRSLLQVFANFTEFNIVTSDSVTGSVTMRLKDVPWDQALEIILQSKGLGMRKVGNVIWIAPNDEMFAKDEALLKAASSKSALEPLRTQLFTLNFAKAVELKEQLLSNQNTPASGLASVTGGAPAQVSGLLSSRGTVIADDRSNQLFVTDISSNLEMVLDFIRRVDVARRQVLIQARIVEASDTFGKSLGVRLGSADLRGVSGGDSGYRIASSNRVAVGGTYEAVSNSTGFFGGASRDTFSNFVNLPSTSDNASKFALSVFSPLANRLLTLELSALEAENRGRIISSPRVVTADMGKATIKQGDRLKFPVILDGKQSSETVEALLAMEVTPQITPEGNVILKLKVTKNRLVGVFSNLPQVSVKEVETEALVQNGGTVVIGGIFEQEERNSEDKTPFLGDIPMIGNLFKRKETDTRKTETLIFITPQILSGSGVVQ